MGIIGSGFLQALGPVLSGAGASLASTGDLSRAPAFAQQFQTAQANQQLRDLQMQRANLQLEEAERQRQEEQAALQAFRGGTGMFGTLTPEQRAIPLTGAQAATLGTKMLERAVMPPTMTPAQKATIEIARAKEAREAAKAAREAKAFQTKQQLQQTILTGLGFGGQPTQQAGFQAVPPGTDPATAQAALGMTPAETATAAGSVPPTIDPTIKRMAAFQVASGDVDAGIKTIVDAQKQINKDFKPTTKQKQDFAKIQRSAAVLQRELKRYQRLVDRYGFAGFDSFQKQQLGQARNFILLQLKDLAELGALQGPDLALLEPMLFNPVIDPQDVGSTLSFIPKIVSTMWRDPSARARASVEQLNDIVSGAVRAQAQQLGMSPDIPVLPEPVLPGGEAPAAAPARQSGTVNAAPAPGRVVVDIEGNRIQ